MKRILILTVCGGLAFASCTDFDFSNDRTQQIKDNAEEIFGIIDPNQDWKMVTSGTVTVTADAPLTDVAKVQILSESPKQFQRILTRTSRCSHSRESRNTSA